MITMKTTTIKTYSELIKLPTWNERFNYLRLNNKIGYQTFGQNRFLNQDFYRNSEEWKRIKRAVVIRDGGNDLGIDGIEIKGPVYIHHINPISEDDILDWTDNLISPDNLICTSFKTHNLIHFGTTDAIVEDYKQREENDTCLWK